MGAQVMATLAQLRTDLKTRADAIAGLSCYDEIPAAIEVPAFVVGPLESLVYNQTAGPTGGLFVFVCRVYAARAEGDEAQLLLDTYCAPTGAKSIKVALEDTGVSNTGSSHWTNVREARNFGQYAFAGIEYLGVEFVVEMVAA